jgi:hypothetical protein
MHHFDAEAGETHFEKNKNRNIKGKGYGKVHKLHKHIDWSLSVQL